MNPLRNDKNTNMKKALLIDDESHSLDMLEYEILYLNKDIEIVAKCGDARKAVQLVENHQPDIVFLDIEMPWLSGFEVLDQLKSIDFSLVFVTAYDQYAINAFKYYAFDYLLKPISRKSLKETLDRIESKSKLAIASEMQDILSLIRKGGMEEGKIALPTQEGFEFYNLDTIVRCQADSNYTQVVISDGKTVLVSKTLKHIEDRIGNTNFFRIHQSHLINVNHIISYSKADGGDVKMSDNATIPISRMKRLEFLEKMKLS